MEHFATPRLRELGFYSCRTQEGEEYSVDSPGVEQAKHSTEKDQLEPHQPQENTTVSGPSFIGSSPSLFFQLCGHHLLPE